MNMCDVIRKKIEKSVVKPNFAQKSILEMNFMLNLPISAYKWAYSRD
jgi:hypothetical protein